MPTSSYYNVCGVPGFGGGKGLDGSFLGSRSRNFTLRFSEVPFGDYGTLSMSGLVKGTLNPKP